MNEFPFNREKAAHAMGFAVHLGSKDPKSLLLNASVAHLLNYGRPICGGTVVVGLDRVYLKELEGWEPTYGYNLDFLSGSDVEAMMHMEAKTMDDPYSEYTLFLYLEYHDNPGPISWLEVARMHNASDALLKYIEQKIENHKLTIS